MINIKNLVKRFGNHVILNNINLQINAGEIIAIIGPSGGGKSTLLRCINKLETYEGDIEIDTSGTGKIGMVFQSFNLFANMNILRNLVYAQRNVLKRSTQESEQKAERLLEKVGLLDAKDKYPGRLSGGQKQRAAIARALCMDPQIMLFDEPTSALDPENVKEVLSTIRTFTHTGMTMLIVTHEMEFANSIADRVIFLDHGSIIEDAHPSQIFSNSSNPRIKTFLDDIK